MLCTFCGSLPSPHCHQSVAVCPLSSSATRSLSPFSDRGKVLFHLRAQRKAHRHTHPHPHPRPRKRGGLVWGHTTIWRELRGGGPVPRRRSEIFGGVKNFGPIAKKFGPILEYQFFWLASRKNWSPCPDASNFNSWRTHLVRESARNKNTLLEKQTKNTCGIIFSGCRRVEERMHIVVDSVVVCFWMELGRFCQFVVFASLKRAPKARLVGCSIRCVWLFHSSHFMSFSGNTYNTRTA